MFLTIQTSHKPLVWLTTELRVNTSLSSQENSATVVNQDSTTKSRAVNETAEI